MSNYAPPDEGPSDLWLERSNLVGAVLGGVAYGIHVAVFAGCARAIYSRSLPNAPNRRLRSLWLLAFITTLFVMGTVNLACNTRVTQLMFIDNRAYPGGPNAWFLEFYSNGANTAGNVSYIINNFLADGLLLWRTRVVWDSWWIIAFPSVIFLGSTAMSIMTIFQSSRPDANLWTSTTVQFTLPYFCISISLNLILTLLLVARLLHMSHNVRKRIGTEHARTYISIASMLVESAAPYAVTGLIFIITYARNSNVQNLVLPVLSQIMCISPEFIILRVATGRAVSTKPPTATFKSMQFVSAAGNDESKFGLTSHALSDHTAGATTLGGPGSRPDLLKEDISV